MLCKKANKSESDSEKPRVDQWLPPLYKRSFFNTQVKVKAHMTWHCASHNLNEKGRFKGNIQHQTKQAPIKNLMNGPCFIA